MSNLSKINYALLTVNEQGNIIKIYVIANHGIKYRFLLVKVFMLMK